MLAISSKKALSFDWRWKDEASGTLEGKGEAAEDGETGVGIAEHGLVSPVQEVHAADEDLEPVGETVAEAGLEVDVAAGYCALAGGEVEVADVHGADAGAEAAGRPVGACVGLMHRCTGIDGVHVQEAVVGIEGECRGDAPIGGELDALIGESPDVAVLGPAVLADHLDDIGTLGVEDAQLGIKGSAEEMVAEGEVVAPGLLGKEFGIGGSVHVELTHVGHAEALGGGQFDGGILSGHIREADLGDPLGAVGAVVVETDAGIEHEPAKSLLVKYIDCLLMEPLVVGVDLGLRVAVGIAAVIDDVGTDGQGIAGEERDHLVCGKAGGEVSAVEEERLGSLAFQMTVVDGMVAEIVVEVDVSRGPVVLVLEGDACHSADDVGPCVEHRGGDCAGILGIGFHQADAGAGLPGGGQLIAELDHSASIVVGGVGAMAGGAVVAEGDGRSETALPEIVGEGGPVGAE